MAKKYVLKGESYTTCGISRVDEDNEILGLYESNEIHDQYRVAKVALLIQLDREALKIKEIITKLEGLDEEAYFKPLEKMYEKV